MASVLAHEIQRVQHDIGLSQNIAVMPQNTSCKQVKNELLPTEVTVEVKYLAFNILV